eukprot:scaffold1355_cov268-Pinguiococcus_pyrenoidosus.AAC.32
MSPATVPRRGLSSTGEQRARNPVSADCEKRTFDSGVSHVLNRPPHDPRGRDDNVALRYQRPFKGPFDAQELLEAKLPFGAGTHRQASGRHKLLVATHLSLLRGPRS